MTAALADVLRSQVCRIFCKFAVDKCKFLGVGGGTFCLTPCYLPIERAVSIFQRRSLIFCTCAGNVFTAYCPLPAARCPLCVCYSICTEFQPCTSLPRSSSSPSSSPYLQRASCSPPAAKKTATRHTNHCSRSRTSATPCRGSANSMAALPSIAATLLSRTVSSNWPAFCSCFSCSAFGCAGLPIRCHTR